MSVSHLALCSGPGAQQDRGNKCVASKIGPSIHPETKWIVPQEFFRILRQCFHSVKDALKNDSTKNGDCLVNCLLRFWTFNIWMLAFEGNLNSPLSMNLLFLDKFYIAPPACPVHQCDTQKTINAVFRVWGKLLQSSDYNYLACLNLTPAGVKTFHSVSPLLRHPMGRPVTLYRY